MYSSLTCYPIPSLPGYTINLLTHQPKFTYSTIYTLNNLHTLNPMSDNTHTNSEPQHNAAPHSKQTVIGLIVGLLAAVCYGFIPFFTLPIKQEGTADFMADPTILFYRFGFASIILALIMLVQRKSFKVTRGELVTLIYLAFISDGSALFLINGYDYMSSGVATTLHFMYPVVTAIIMMMFYNEARRFSTIFAVCMAVAGVAVFSWDPNGHTDIKGVVIVLISAVCYALYIIRVNRSRAATMDSSKLVFYVMFIGSLIFGAEAMRQGNFTLIHTSLQWSHLLPLAFVCTFITNLSLVFSVKRIGSTMVAVLGALEPLTAVVIGCVVFGEPITWQVILGVLLIIPAVLMIILTRRR